MLQTSPQLSYRQDINGLRAWAVLAVILYHFNVPGFSAGFIGVDLFFVISGYLMTAILVRGLEQNTLSLVSFYLARLRRIGPALWVLLLSLLVLGWFFLPTSTYQDLGLQSLYALGFLSNILYWNTAGYFDTVAHEKWLLHTWTLGVEFQFYVLYPLVLLAIWKIKANTKALFFGVAALCIGSLSLSIWSSFWSPATGFYLLPFRAWEFLSGGLIVLGSNLRGNPNYSNRWLLWLGLGLWLTALLLINNQWAWPAGWAVLPVLSAVCIIAAQKTRSVLTVNPIMQWLGERSYSLYLWHWPAMVALYFFDLQYASLWVTLGLIISFLLGDLSYRYIETPTRQGLIKYTTLQQQSILFLCSLLLVALAALNVHWFNFNRLTQAAELAANEAHNRNPRWKECFDTATAQGSVGCIFGAESVGAILIGDSHAASIVSAVGSAAQLQRQGVIFWGMAACPPLDNVKYPSYIPFSKNSCLQFNQWIDEKLSDYPNIPLILASRTSDYLLGPNEPDRSNEIDRLSIYFSNEYNSRLEPAFQQEFTQTLIDTACRLAEQRPVYLLRPVPEFGVSVPHTLSKRLLINQQAADITMPRQEYEQRHQLVWAAQNQAAAQCHHVHVLDPSPYLCDESYCYGSKNGRPLYIDDDHLSEYGNRYLEPLFHPIFTQ